MAARRLRSHGILLAVFGLLVLLSHQPFLAIPYFWDELGQFVPASYDLYTRGLWVPVSTVPNVHPPGLMAYLAGVWRVTGYSVEATRLAMLAWATAGVWLTFLLAVRLCRALPGHPAFLPPLLLLVSPWFVAQAPLANLDLPAMVLTTATLLLFLEGRVWPAVAAATALVMVKETGALVPLACGAWLARHGRRREAALFLLPLVPLAAWLAVLWQATGNLLGNREFAEYNALYPLHPVRLSLALLRRAYSLFVGSFQWIGTLALAYALRRSGTFHTREWRFVAAVMLGHVVMVCVLGGATLERYLLPVLPVLYVAMAAAITQLPGLWRRTAAVGLVAGLAAANFLNPPYPFPHENNLAWRDFVLLHEQAARHVELVYPQATVATAWPLTDALQKTELGYVERPVAVRPLADFRAENVLDLRPGEFDLLLVYSRHWDGPPNVMQWAWFRELMERYYDFAPEVTAEQVRQQFGLDPLVRWERRGQWVVLYGNRPR